jgi:hypothetical protein
MPDKADKTAVAHLAGSLAVPAWVAVPFAPDWRWLRVREDTPWYPTTRLFRQPRRGDWGPVFERIARELAERVAAEARGLGGEAATPEGAGRPSPSAGN